MGSFRKMECCFVCSKSKNRDFYFSVLTKFEVLRTFEIFQDNRVSGEFEVEVDFDKDEFSSLPGNFINQCEIFPKSFYVVGRTYFLFSFFSY